MAFGVQAPRLATAASPAPTPGLREGHDERRTLAFTRLKAALKGGPNPDGGMSLVSPALGQIPTLHLHASGALTFLGVGDELPDWADDATLLALAA